MKMSNYKNPQVMSSSGMDNQDALSLAVRLYGHFLHNLVEEGFEGVENAVRIPETERSVCLGRRLWAGGVF